ncbi:MULTISPECIES: aryl-sulfate sulfotransferase [unclassified Brenneria]|uniref:aryl-sulfate sulfotransferase n=1 Tax=unclassified Brenneria TaxID=2634434 RepID=UPI0029C21FDE|nr:MULTISPECIES: aryl-sulfate sulfotransferase [unclassified Brenneria]MDX5629541.1 aryl-sulfate sulfotransferase [Brenneria sp. L3-3Z]MDX5696680.1 aryl-sulfate sulfotransferase [Brenneria sp. L4-2C]
MSLPAIPEQQTQIRRGTGLTALNADKAYPGYTLFTTLSGDGIVYLIDLSGQVVHQWKLPYSPYYAELLPNGNLYFNGWTPIEPGDVRFDHWPLYKAGVILEVDWDGNIVWEYHNPDHHHDSRRAHNGNTYLLSIEQTPAEVASKIKGQIAQDNVWNDKIVELDANGEVVWEWHAWQHFDQLKDFPVHASEDPHHWPHANSLFELRDGNLLLSFRGISHVVVVDRQSGKIIWDLGHDVVSQQHAPVELENGNFLIFDNGTQRLHDSHTYSRVIEVDRKTKDIVWEYQDTPAYNFYSAFISGAQRLPNGNTLITEGLNGRIFEVTPAREVVWEYVNPYFSEFLFNNRDKSIPESLFRYYGGSTMNSIFRSFRYAREQLPNLAQ